MNKKIVLAIIVFWVILAAVFALSGEFTMRTGKEVLLKTVPVDPRDLLRGDYVTLSYEISRLPKVHRFDIGQTVYVVLKTDDKNVATVDSYSYTIPKNKFFIKGKVHKFLWSGREIKYGIESYFVKEGTGKELENKLRTGTYAKVLIDKNGNAKVKELVY